MFNFVRNHWTVVLRWLHHFAFPPTARERSCCSASSWALGVVSVREFGSSVRMAELIGVWWYLLVLPSVSLMMWRGAFFSADLSFVYWARYLFTLFAHFFNWVVCFLIVEFWELFVFFRNKSFIRCVFWKYFLPVCGSSFFFFHSLCLSQNSFYFNKVPFMHSSSPGSCLVSYLKTCCQPRVT